MKITIDKVEPTELTGDDVNASLAATLGSRIYPKGDRVAVLPIDVGECLHKEDSVIAIPVSAAYTLAREYEYRMGRVIAVGPGKEGHPVGVEIGECVLWRKFTGTEHRVSGETIVILAGDELLGVVEDG